MKINTNVTEIVKDRNNYVQCGNEQIEADQFLLTAGAWTSQLAKGLGYRIPLVAGKGYSITISNSNLTFGLPMSLTEAKVGICSYNGAIRIGGTMELSGFNTYMDLKRLQQIRDGMD